ncbi:hypothetical protein Mp_2g21250 [Marchantia polymorpha subsp. ruderalis]|uniref:Uncharacterized protein n=1 Tax=Marchantia polymorpha TaxID=3197 RepID=A0A2R6X2T4_MARPO|nr:hypothetical protein MARPO_0040s0089 [Marchantia polymorpha]BBN03160.1 hypothetical protein Mp_2g21250 [Marchantia polymorpha subsp. ruderalis]|eukprot:PTQ40417.1 hypothetical protein MARPO_0040s0089 [Marchantia polymorpha]
MNSHRGSAAWTRGVPLSGETFCKSHNSRALPFRGPFRTSLATGALRQRHANSGQPSGSFAVSRVLVSAVSDRRLHAWQECDLWHDRVAPTCRQWPACERFFEAPLEVGDGKSYGARWGETVAIYVSSTPKVKMM